MRQNGPAGIRIEQEGNRIRLTGWVGPKTPELCKAVGAGRFSKTGSPHWSFPLDVATCRRMRKVFGEALEIGPALEAWAWEAFEAERRLVGLGRAGTGTPTLLPTANPELFAKMRERPYQLAAVEFIGTAGNVLLADEAGLGKTYELLGGIIERPSNDADEFAIHRARRHLIFAPSTAVLSVWAPEIETVHPWDARIVAVVGPGVKRHEILANNLAGLMTCDQYFICNTEMVRIKPEGTGKKAKYLVENAIYPELFSLTWDTIVVDECHLAVIKPVGGTSQQLEGLRKLKGHHKIAASGTPMRGQPERLWATLNWLRPDLYTSYWRWVGDYFELGNNGFTEHDSVVGDLKRPKAYTNSLRSIMLRRTALEVRPELPPIQYAGTHLIPRDKTSPKGTWLELNEKQTRQYRLMVAEGVVESETGEMMANGVLAEDARKMLIASSCVQINELGELVPVLPSPKFDWLLDKITELNGERLVVGSKFTRLIDMFAGELRKRGVECHVLTGNTSKTVRPKLIQDFQSATPSASVFLLNIKAGGVAVTLDKADYGVALDETRDPDPMTQFERRIWRPASNNSHNATWYYLRSRNTIEEDIAWDANANFDKKQWILDGSRGVANTKKLQDS